MEPISNNQKTLMAGLTGAGAGLLHSNLNGDDRVSTILRALGYGGAAALATHGLQAAMDRSLGKTADQAEFERGFVDKMAEYNPGMEKEALLPLLAGLGFGLYSAYQGGKHLWKGGKHFKAGRGKEGFKSLGRAGLEGAYAIPGIGWAGRAMRIGGKTVGMAAKARAAAGLAGSAAKINQGVHRAAVGAHNVGGTLSKINGGRFLNPKSWKGHAALLGGIVGGDMMLGPEYAGGGTAAPRHVAQSAAMMASRTPWRGRRPLRAAYQGGPNTYFGSQGATSAPRMPTQVGGYGGFAPAVFR